MVCRNDLRSQDPERLCREHVNLTRWTRQVQENRGSFWAPYLTQLQTMLSLIWSFCKQPLWPVFSPASQGHSCIPLQLSKVCGFKVANSIWDLFINVFRILVTHRHCYPYNQMYVSMYKFSAPDLFSWIITNNCRLFSAQLIDMRKRGVELLNDFVQPDHTFG